MATKELKPYEQALFGLRSIHGSVNVRVTEWQQYLTDYSGMPIIAGRVYRMKSEDIGGGMVRVFLVSV